MSIKTKILAPMIILTIVVAAAILLSNIVLFSGFVDKTMLDNVTAAANVASNNLETLKSGATTASMGIAANQSVVNAIINNDRNALLTQAKQIQDKAGVEFCTITDPYGTVILRTHEPENYGDSVASQANVKSAMAGNGLTAVEAGTAVLLSVRASSPIIDNQGVLVGIASVGYRLDTETFVDSIKALLDCEATVFLGDERISTTVMKEDGTRAIGTKAVADISESVLAGNTYIGDADILGQAAVASYVPIIGPDNSPVGMLFAGYYTDETVNTILAFVRTGSIITLIMLIMSIAVILIVVRRIVAPIRTMVGAASALAAGDTDIEIKVDTRDEMRSLADAFNEMIENTRQQVKTIEHIADGDLAVSLKARSGKDLMNTALVSMLDMNNAVFANIATAANQVKLGAQQIADSSQSLAQGSTEQAASISELSGTITNIAEKTKVNAEMAEKTAALTDTIRNSAEKSTRQMDEMINAAKEINQSSQNIGKVIKVIDDIAFQTNILALNAAVEAARAGQHGKGFAVVAEEVRNLASKSAEAAKDTGAMIQDSIDKAELNSRIANETAVSLTEIISGINESNQLINEIARSSAEQSTGISQINTGIDQIAQVVQQNSATAEENAAASEEMSGQSDLLSGLVSQFKLK